MAEVIEHVDPGLDWQLVELLVLDLDNFLFLLRQLVVLEILVKRPCIHIVIGVNILLLFGSFLFSLLGAYKVLAFNVERIFATELKFKEANQL